MPLMYSGGTNFVEKSGLFCSLDPVMASLLTNCGQIQIQILYS